ncbi:hypothetical protein, partial [uncultured Maribacter sp.]|uniref:hypothetical protein n=1 Tax=uncultured Maribacter sp. TaxID=431308 RepID=UPI00263940DB
PGEVSKATSWPIGEVSRSHSTYGKRAVNRNHIGLTSREGQNIKLRWNSTRMQSKPILKPTGDYKLLITYD